MLQEHYRLMALGERPAAGWRLYSGNFSLPRALFDQVNGFDLEMGHIRGEDVELGFRLEEAGATFRFAPAAAAVHRGYRSFSSWCNAAYILGVRDVTLIADRGRSQLLPRLGSWFQGKPAVLRWAVQLSLGRAKVQQTLVKALRMGATAATWLRFGRLGHLGYSAIFNLNYWRGVAEELRGVGSLHEIAVRRSPSGERLTGETSSKRQGHPLSS